MHQNCVNGIEEIVNHPQHRDRKTTKTNVNENFIKESSSTLEGFIISEQNQLQ